MQQFVSRALRAVSGGMTPSEATPSSSTAAPSLFSESGHSEMVCPQCARVNAKGRTRCVDCDAQLPVSSLDALWASDDDRTEMIAEAKRLGIILAIVSVVMLVSSFVPLGIRLLIFVATIAILLWRFRSKIITG